MIKNEINLGVVGAAGKMGLAIIQRAMLDEEFSDIYPFEYLGFSDDSINIYNQRENKIVPLHLIKGIDNFTKKLDVLIDFSLPSSTEITLRYASEVGVPLVIGTTGIDSLSSTIDELSKDIPIFVSPNMSIGVNLCFKLAGLARQTLGKSYDVEIIEAHHRGKRDAPSGTALNFGKIIADVTGEDLSVNAVYERKGLDSGREENAIGFQTIRAGDIVGDHTVLFASEGERIEITHRATNRTAFVAGALKAAKWLIHQDSGLYSFDDIL